MRRSPRRTPAPLAVAPLAAVVLAAALGLAGCGEGTDAGDTAPAGVTTTSSSAPSAPSAPDAGTTSSSAASSSSASAPVEESPGSAPAEEGGPVQILSPVDGATVPAGSLTISGSSTSYEGNLLWEVADASGAVVAEGFTTGGANGEVGDFSTTAEGLVAGTTYTVSVWAPDESDGESGKEPRADGDTATVTAG